MHLFLLVVLCVYILYISSSIIIVLLGYYVIDVALCLKVFEVINFIIFTYC